MTPPPDQHDPREPDPPSGALPPEDASVPYEEDALEMETPRRTASAEFVVDSSVGSEALLREAMDPANQSLAEALRLSYRVLQIVMLVLIVLFVFSGVQTVQPGQTGVLLRWGKILTVGGSAALQPGLQFSKWPYPAGEFVLFDETNRRINLGNVFWPDLRGRSLEDAIAQATKHGQLRPGRDGSLLAESGDIAHMKIQARYQIDAPERFVYAVANESSEPDRLVADRLVQLALQRAAVHHAAGGTLQEVVDVDAASLRTLAQEVLTEVDSGIRIQDIEFPVEPTPALAIKRAHADLQEAKYLREREEKRAEQDEQETLLGVAGSAAPSILAAIDAYEREIGAGDEAAAEARLREIYAQLESDAASGEVTRILEQARAYRSEIERTLGYEATRFASNLAAYRAHPELVVMRLWMETYATVLARPDTEIIYAPPGDGVLTLAITGLDHIRQERRKNQLDRKEQETYLGNVMTEGRYIPRARDIRDGPGRQLSETGGGLGADR